MKNLLPNCLKMEYMTGKFYCKNVSDTHRIAKELAKCIQAPLFISLVGDLGAGKTEFVRGFVSAFDISEVLSPTYTIVREIPSNPKIYHFDVYRLNDVEELYNVGYSDYRNENCIILMEWADKFPEILPEKYISVEISGCGLQERQITINKIGN